MKASQDITIRTVSKDEFNGWDNYVLQHDLSNLYHLSAWKRIIERTYGHKAYYLVAVTTNKHGHPDSHHLSFPTAAASRKLDSREEEIAGILPLVHLKHFYFGNSLVSIPFFDFGGILADDEKIERKLLSEAIKLAERLGVNELELRHIQSISNFDELDSIKDNILSPATSLLPAVRPHFSTRAHKVRMILQLPECPEVLMKSFKSKLRSQIRKPLKEGLYSRIAGCELLEDFYKVFSSNMRDLGSPVHAKKLMKNVLESYPDESRIVMVYNESLPIACSLIVGFKNTMQNPWASALRKYSRLSPNMLLYWAMLEYSCANGYTHFDFGRSSPDEGTYNFKKQWGAQPTPLHWHNVFLNGQPNGNQITEKTEFNKAIHYWQKLPLTVTKLLGPTIRKHISL